MIYKLIIAIQNLLFIMNHLVEGKGHIYCLTSPTMKQYIGQAVCYTSSGKPWGMLGRWRNHIYKALHPIQGSNQACCRALDAAIRKYDAKHFVLELLFVCEESELDYWETWFIKQHNTLSPNGYNLTEGGGSGKWSESSRRLMSEKMKALGGHAQSTSTRAKISSTLKQYWSDSIRERNYLKRGVAQPRQPRKNKDDAHLPKYISSCKRKGIKVGYYVNSHPNQKGASKTFSRSEYSMEEKLEMAIEYLQSLDQPDAVQRPDGGGSH